MASAPQAMTGYQFRAIEGTAKQVGSPWYVSHRRGKYGIVQHKGYVRFLAGMCSRNVFTFT